MEASECEVKNDESKMSGKEEEIFEKEILKKKFENQRIKVSAEMK